jgi:hypothetical protein
LHQSHLFHLQLVLDRDLPRDLPQGLLRDLLRELERDLLRSLLQSLHQSNLLLLQGLHPRNILLFGQMGGWACWSARLRLYQTYRKSRVTNPMIDYQSSQVRQSQSTLNLAASHR